MDVRTESRRPPVLWDVVEEHAGDAAFLWLLRERWLLAPDADIAQVESRIESRLLAHLDALVLGRERVARKVLVPALQGDDPEAAAAAAWCLLASEDGDFTAPVLEALAAGPEEVQPALARAIALSARQDLGRRLAGTLAAASPSSKKAMLAALAARGEDPGPGVAQVDPADAALLAAALRAARFAPAPAADALLRAGLADPRPPVLEAALETGLALGRRAAWQAALSLLDSGAPLGRAPLLALSVGGGHAELKLLARRAANPAERDEVLWALGFSGRTVAAETALAQAADGAGRVAAEAFAAITGFPLAYHVFLEPPSEGEEEEEIEAEGPAPDAFASRLPGPAFAEGEVAADVMQRWWADHGSRFDPAGRTWHGTPLTPEVLAGALLGAPARWRPALAYEVSLRARGAPPLDPLDWIPRQRARLGAVRALPAAGLLRPLSETMTT